MDLKTRVLLKSQAHQVTALIFGPLGLKKLGHFKGWVGWIHLAKLLCMVKDKYFDVRRKVVT